MGLGSVPEVVFFVVQNYPCDTVLNPERGASGHGMGPGSDKEKGGVVMLEISQETGHSSLAPGPEGRADQDRRIELSGRLTINEVDEIKKVLIDAFGGAGGLCLDASGLESVDAAGVQLLVALRHSAHQAGKSIRFGAPPAGALLEALVRVGFRSDGDDTGPRAGQDSLWWG